jgi:hypothetical protein
MTAANPAGGNYDDYASQYAANMAWRERAGPDNDPFGLLLPMFELLGDVTGHGCSTPAVERGISPGRWWLAGHMSPASTCHRA